MCAVDIETTGISPGYHEILQIAILPLDNWLEPRKDLPPFDIFIRPTYPDRIDLDSLSISKSELYKVCDVGVDSEKALELFEYWWQKLNLGLNKRIIPLGYNICMFDLPFIREWMGAGNFNKYISAFARDVMLVAHYLNDVADVNVEPCPFSKYKLKDVARAVGVEVFESETHAALYDAYLAAEVYKKLLHHHILNAI